MKNKYNIGDKVKTKIHYQNDKRKEVEAIVLGIELGNETNIKYRIEFEPEEPDKKIRLYRVWRLYQWIWYNWFMSLNSYSMVI